MPKKKKSSIRSKEYWDVSNWLWEGLDSDDELLIAYNRRPSEDMTSMCALCYQWFKSSDDFHSHMVTHIDTSRFHECSVCKKRFLARFLRMRHESIHRYESNHPFTAYWGSEHCDFPQDYFVKNHPMKRFKTVPYSPHYLKHLRRIEKLSEAEPISCIVCLQIFQDYDDLAKHYDLKHAIQQCVQCNDALENFTQYEAHMREKHNIEMPINCSGGRWQILDQLSQPVDHELEQRRATVRFFHNYADPNSSPPKTYARTRSESGRNIFIQKPVLKPEVSLSTTLDASDYPSELLVKLDNDNESIESDARRDTETDNEPLDPKDSIDRLREPIIPEADVKFEVDCDMPVLFPVTDEIEWVDPEKDRVFPCQVCGRVFTDERTRNRHRRLHNVPGEKPFECKYCKKAFATHSNRKEHERIHTGERPYKCPVCERRFIQISNLKKHIQTHKDLNTLKCTTCGKQFVKESSLVLHQRSHATERKFRCDICDRAYNYASLLKRHMRIHTGECPYQCPDCQMPFHELVSLHYHRKKMHTGERPHKCQICGRGFILSSDLKKHHKVHMKDPEKERSKVSTNASELNDSLSRENGLTNSSADSDDEESENDSIFKKLNPEITLVVQNSESADDGNESRVLHYEIQDVKRNDEPDVNACSYEAIEVDDSHELQIFSVKEINGDEDRRILTNGNSARKTTSSRLKANAKLLESGKNDSAKNNDENHEKTSKQRPATLRPGVSNSTGPKSIRFAKMGNNNIEAEAWTDEEPLLIDDSWVDG
ncbi:unnamed protein product [Allacma fusca]|uniref:C2H2-type domain-containing protein n=1 Tax=Allacma fusca TaxID=39272 RepID=A0A8J2LUP3_9HEXA|nr:unnamed protein product [Allacma fusca]